MQVRILGPLQLEDLGADIPVGGTRQRAVLAALLLQPNQVVPSERLVVDLWGEEASRNAANALQAAVSRLRRTLPVGRLSTTAGGYRLRLLGEELDAGRFEQLVTTGREQLLGGQAELAAQTLRQALAMWQGPALADFRYEPFAQAEIARLDELRLSCHEARIEADLACDRAGEVVGELHALVAEHPTREGLHRQLMIALYRSGRQAEALAAYRRLRRVMATELGLEPSPALAELEASILRHDPSLDPAPAPGGPGQTRRTISVLCARLQVARRSGSAMDPEALDAIQARGIALFSAVLARYGGQLAGSTGEQLTGVFGVTSVHEDDALRAARASLEAGRLLALEATSLLDRHGIELIGSFGVATGEALVGAHHPHGFSGQPGGRAVALASVAAPGEILISPETLALASGAVEVGSVSSGRPDCFRLISAREGARPLTPDLDVPLTGRAGELDRLQATFAGAVRRRGTVLVTLLGEAGLGKTRLAHELVTRLGSTATVLTGRCLPYGEGITFWPLREVVLQVCGGQTSLAAVRAVLGAGPEAEIIAERLSQAINAGGPGRADGTEIHWAARSFLEAAARARPLLLIFEDVHWAEPAFLDLVESIAAQPGPSTQMVLCVARPDLLELRPAWAEGTRRSETVELTPLDAGNAAALLDALGAGPELTAPTRARILQTAGGNPFYIEQLAIWLTEHAWHETGPALPPTIQALLAARLSRLTPGERQVLTAAAIVGERFGLPPLTGLLPPEAHRTLGAHLRALIAKGLVGPAKGGAEEAYGFRHILIQEAAYRAVPKAVRADLHERLADRLEAFAGKPAAQWQEILGYHLEQAARYVDDLAADPRRHLALAGRAAGHLETAGRSAQDRDDAHAAVNLLQRAATLLPEPDPAKPRILSALGVVLAEVGRFVDAQRALVVARELAAAGGDRDQQARAQVQALFLGLQVDPDRVTAQVNQQVPELRGVFEQAGDHLGLCRVLRLEASVHWNRACSGEAEDAWRRAAEHARQAGEVAEVADIVGWLASAALWGPTPADEGILRCERFLDDIGGRPTSRASILMHLAGLLAMRDRLPEARARLNAARTILRGLGPTVTGAITQPAAYVAMLAGDHARAETYLRAEYDSLQDMGDKGFLATSAALLARAIVLQQDGRDDEVEGLIATSRAAGAGEDLSAQIIGDGVLARVLAGRGQTSEATTLATAAVDLAAGTDLISQHADTLIDLAQVHLSAGSPARARRAGEQALALYRRKGDLPGARQAHRVLERLAPP